MRNAHACILFLWAAVIALHCATVQAQETAAPDTDSFWSRITLGAPFFTHHVPRDAGYNDHNWGGLVDYALDAQSSLVAGDFINSYRRNTAFVAYSWLPLDWSLADIPLRAGAMAGGDLNGGYRNRSPVDPLLFAFSVRIGSAGSDARGSGFADRAGLALTAIPGSTLALNLAFTWRL